jgi:hypothetical protein
VTPGAVLLGADCPGACALGALAVVARRDGTTGRPGRPLWLAGAERPERARALVDWVRAGGPASLEDPARDLPAALRPALVPVAPTRARPAGTPRA